MKKLIVVLLVLVVLVGVFLRVKNDSRKQSRYALLDGSSVSLSEGWYANRPSSKMMYQMVGRDNLPSGVYITIICKKEKPTAAILKDGSPLIMISSHKSSLGSFEELLAGTRKHYEEVLPARPRVKYELLRRPKEIRVNSREFVELEYIFWGTTRGIERQCLSGGRLYTMLAASSK